VVDEHALAAEAEVRMPVRAALAPATPSRRLLLRDPDRDHAEAALTRGLLQVGTDALLLRLASDEADKRDLMLGSEALDRCHIATADIAEQRRRRDRKTPVEQEAHDHPLAHQSRHIAVQEDPVDRAHLQGDPVAQ